MGGFNVPHGYNNSNFNNQWDMNHMNTNSFNNFNPMPNNGFRPGVHEFGQRHAENINTSDRQWEREREMRSHRDSSRREYRGRDHTRDRSYDGGRDRDRSHSRRY